MTRRERYLGAGADYDFRYVTAFVDDAERPQRCAAAIGFDAFPRHHQIRPRERLRKEVISL
ncbi:hypothetical protein LGM46_11360 [Burkholderia arboris]|uniref:hypothetical protein n=1 Tax=Burkholderia cepacia complex TaxID=87882 RepID=UPI0012D8BA2C|nr:MULTISPECIES: hypothetical protein [Burkholderia cepacia complex]MCA8033584.1 hypothetical protein [Burkholderia arboris]